MNAQLESCHRNPPIACEFTELVRLIDYRTGRNAVGLGQAATEYDPKGKAAAELRAAFDEVKRFCD